MFFTLLEHEILMRSYDEYEHFFRKLKSNTTIAAKEKVMSWDKIADQVNV